MIFTKLCPLTRSEPRDTYTHQRGTVLIHFRTRTEAHFALRTSWEHPAAFYERLPKFWPGLTFVCSVNEDMGQCGGVIVVMQGEVHDLVRDFDAAYDRRQHRRQVRSVLKRVDALVAEGRPWRLMPYSAWEHRCMPFDAVFDDDFWFYFRTREEMVAFGTRYRSRYAGPSCFRCLATNITAPDEISVVTVTNAVIPRGYSEFIIHGRYSSHRCAPASVNRRVHIVCHPRTGDAFSRRARKRSRVH